MDLEGDRMSSQEGQESPDQPVGPPAGLPVSQAGLGLCSPPTPLRSPVPPWSSTSSWEQLLTPGACCVIC